jgi:peptidyl-prolyl cis-trans isomerase A (cyclophilin A)
MMSRMPVVLMVAVFGALAGCGGPGREASAPSSEAAQAAAPEPAKPANPLLDPAQAQETAPDTFRARFETTKGEFTVEVVRDWAPRGADRFYNLVKLGFYDDVALFRIVEGFVAQFGISGDPAVSRAWSDARIPDDPVKESNLRGTLTYAKTNAPHSRTTQLFINYADNDNLDGYGFAPFGRVVEGMEVVDSFYSGYGENVDQGLAERRGNDYFRNDRPKLDFVERVTLVEEPQADFEETAPTEE